MICSSCRLKFTDVTSYKLHRSTEFHNYNTKRQIANLEPISEELFEEKRIIMQQSNVSISTETKWKCKACSKTFKTLESLDEHKRSKKHKKNEKDFISKNPESNGSSIFKSITHETSDFLSDLNRSLQQKDPEAMREEVDKIEDKPHVPTSLESLRICFFCNLESQGVKRNLDHMRVKHGFTIMDIECLINLKGLLAYIAERIQLGKLCLLCSKSFSTADRCQ